MVYKLSEISLTADEISASPWEPFGDVEGVFTKRLWKDTSTGSYAGVLRLDGGASVPEHAHQNEVHHIWVIDGTCSLGGRSVPAGSYAYVPPDVEHWVTNLGDGPCTLFYLYLTTRTSSQRRSGSPQTG